MGQWNMKKMNLKIKNKFVHILLFILLIVISYNYLYEKENKEERNKKVLIQTNLMSFKPEDTMDPTKLSFVQEYFVLDNITAKLIQVGEDGEYKNDLAEHVKFSDDKLTIDIKLKDDAKFSDGSTILAQDVAQSFKRSILWGVPHIDLKNLWIGADHLKSMDEDMPGIKVLSDKELRLTLVKPTKEILFFLTITDLAILHKSQYEKKHLKVSDWEKVTSGSYRIGYTNEGKIMLISNKNSHNFKENMPQRVVFSGYKNANVVRQLEEKSLDFGMLTLSEYFPNVDRVEASKDFDVVSNKTDGVVHIILNAASGLFQKIENRQWIQKKMIENYKVDKKYFSVLTKAFQFFIPNSKGYKNDVDVLNILKEVDTSKVPEDLKSGITIKTIEGMKYFLPDDMETKLSQTLGIPVNLEVNIPEDEYLQTVDKERNFDATIMAISMDYKVINEALNLQYLSENSSLIDPTGKIRDMLKAYQSEDDIEKESEIIINILNQMIYDSESVPIFYFASPFLIKKNTIQSSSVNFHEPIKFHKMVMK